MNLRKYRQTGVWNEVKHHANGRVRYAASRINRKNHGLEVWYHLDGSTEHSIRWDHGVRVS